MRGILIDPFEQSITEVDPKDTAEWKALIHVDWITAVELYRDPKTDHRETLWIDDEGLYMPDQKYFQWKGYDQPLAGRGIILGTDAEGETIGTEMDFEQVKRHLKWLPNIEFTGITTETKEHVKTMLGDDTFVVEQKAHFNLRPDEAGDVQQGNEAQFQNKYLKRKEHEE